LKLTEDDQEDVQRSEGILEAVAGGAGVVSRVAGRHVHQQQSRPAARTGGA